MLSGLFTVIGLAVVGYCAVRGALQISGDLSRDLNRRLRLPSLEIGAATQAMIDNMREHPEHWYYRQECVLEHRPSGLELWVHIGPGYIHIHRTPSSNADRHVFTFAERRAIWRASRPLRRKNRNSERQEAEAEIIDLINDSLPGRKAA